MNWHDITPPKWKSVTAKQEFLDRPIPDPTKNECGICHKQKFLIRNQATDEYHDTFICVSCDGGEI